MKSDEDQVKKTVTHAGVSVLFWSEILQKIPKLRRPTGELAGKAMHLIHGQVAVFGVAQVGCFLPIFGYSYSLKKC